LGKQAGSRRVKRGAEKGEGTYKGEALVGMKSKGSQLRRQNIVLDLEVVVAISSLVVDALLLTVGKDFGFHFSPWSHYVPNASTRSQKTVQFERKEMFGWYLN